MFTFFQMDYTGLCEQLFAGVARDQKLLHLWMSFCKQWKQQPTNQSQCLLLAQDDHLLEKVCSFGPSEPTVSIEPPWPTQGHQQPGSAVASLMSVGDLRTSLATDDSMLEAICRFDTAEKSQHTPIMQQQETNIKGKLQRYIFTEKMSKLYWQLQKIYRDTFWQLLPHQTIQSAHAHVGFLGNDLVTGHSSVRQPQTIINNMMFI